MERLPIDRGRATPEGGDLRIAAVPEGGALRLSIADNGGGIPAEMAERGSAGSDLADPS